MKIITRALSSTLIAAATFVVIPTVATAASPEPVQFSANVMAPLEVLDWATFDNQLQTVKDYGVNGVTVDVWWGKVEKTDNVFDWTYFDTIFSHIKQKGLDIVPILSFHQCGGNVGDTCDIPLPSWIWSKYANSKINGVTVGQDGLKHKSEQGKFSKETVAGWADTLVAKEYTDFAKAFADHYYQSYKSVVREINISMGPAGELRYPSYNGHDIGTGYPTRGALQAYSTIAVASFRAFAVQKYGTLAGVNAAWGTNLASTNDIKPPSNAQSFFELHDYVDIKYGRDFVDWYNQSLVDHGKAMLTAVISGLGTSFPGANLGYKIPGVHWAMTNPAYPRAAEVAAGLIQTSVDMDADSTGHGYTKIIGLAKGVQSSRAIVLHFTCLEMDNQETNPAYSQAEALVFWIGAEAKKQGVPIKGENALSGGVTSNAGWDNIENVFTWSSYRGFTALRISDVTSGTGKQRYTAFIQKYRGTSLVILHYAEFEYANYYLMHGSNGFNYNVGMNSEGWINGRHWWVQAIYVPTTFTMIFSNNKVHLDTTKREYKAQAGHIYILPKDPKIYTSRPQ